MRQVEGARGDVRIVETAPTAAAVVSSVPREPRWTMQRPGAALALVEKPRIAGRFLATKPEPWTSRWVKKPLVAVLAAITSLVRRRITADIQVTSGDWVKTMRPNEPYLWLATHQTTLDFINMFPLQTQLPGHPDVRIASRTYGDTFMGKLVSFLVRPFVFHLHRPNMGEGATPAEVEKLRQLNENEFRRGRERMAWGSHAMAFPEGTTMTDGAVAWVKNGTFKLTMMPNPDGSISVVPIVPVSNTMDLLAAEEGKTLTFINVGEPVSYAPVEPKPGETAEAYKKRDMDTMSKRVHAELVRLSTVTTTQIVGAYMIAKANRGETSISYQEVRELVARNATSLVDLGLSIDTALTSSLGRKERVGALWANLERLGYVKREHGDDYSIDVAKVRHEAIDTSFDARNAKRYRRYRKENPLRYCANRLLQVAEHNPSVKRILAAT